MDEDDARQLADRLLADAGGDPADYDEPSVELDEGEWVALYQGQSGAPGDHVMVVIDDASGEGRVVWGR